MAIISMKDILIFNPRKALKICQVKSFFLNQKSEVVSLSDIQFEGIFVKNLPYKISEQDIKEFFNNCGKITETEMIMNGRKKFLGHCYIGFESSESVQKALLLSGHPMSGRFLKIENVSKEKFKFIKANLLERRITVTKESTSSGEKDFPDNKAPWAKKNIQKREWPLDNVLFSESNSTDIGDRDQSNSNRKRGSSNLLESTDFDSGLMLLANTSNGDEGEGQPDVSKMIRAYNSNADYANCYATQDQPEFDLKLSSFSGQIPSGHASMNQHKVLPPPGLAKLTPPMNAGNAPGSYPENSRLAQFKYQQHLQKKY